ncbi:MAG: hypothetical protein ACXW4U_15080 [Anaerolineales bacterium]
MRLFYGLFIVVQLVPAVLSRDPNRVAYLKYLWSTFMGGKGSFGDTDEDSSLDSDYRETKTEAISYEYSLLLER